jgi:AcrR family transcriptional regulator
MPASQPPPGAADDSRERILAAATSLFAEHGYDGATTRLVAAAAGLNIATVAYHVGSKAELYREVIRRAHVAEAVAVEAALEAFGAAAAGDATAAVRGLVGAYLDFCLAHPQVPALWMRRWLSDAAEVTGPEAEYAKPLIDAVCGAVARDMPDVAERADVEMTVWTILWSTHGFCCSGILDAQGVRRGPETAAAVARFRAHLERLALRELGLGASR